MPLDHLAAARSARMALERMLETDAPALRSSVPVGFADGAERFVALLLDANARINLTRVVEPDAIARLHLLDALSALPLIDRLEPSRALDLGSGGGVPGIVLALARPGVAWVLVDSVRKKADMLAAFVDALGLGAVTVRSQRAEDLGRAAAWRESIDVVTARACAPLPVLAEYALPLLRVGGSLVAWKGPIGNDELSAGDRAARRLGGGRAEVRPTDVAALGDHRFVLVQKRSSTPEAYPRRPGEPSRRPLG